MGRFSRGSQRIRAVFALGAALGLCPAVAAREATGEGLSVESARTLFYRALALQDRGRWADALALLESVAETRESAQVRFNIAFNQEHLGHLVDAARGYESAVRLAEQSDAQSVVSAANFRLARLSSLIGRLVLRPEGDAVAVAVDGVEISPDVWGRGVPVETGSHVISARREGYEPYRVEVALSAGETRELSIELVPVVREPAVELRPTVPQVGRAREPLSAPNEPQHSKASALPYVAAGAAIASFATAAVFFALRNDALDTMRERCNGTRCPEELRSTDDLGSFYTTAANVALAAGVGFAGVSVGLFVAELPARGQQKGALGLGTSVSTSF